MIQPDGNSYKTVMESKPETSEPATANFDDPCLAANVSIVRHQLFLWEEKLAKKQAGLEVVNDHEGVRSCKLQRMILQDTIGIIDAYGAAHEQFKELVPLVWEGVEKGEVVPLHVMNWFNNLVLFAKERKAHREAKNGTPGQR